MGGSHYEDLVIMCITIFHLFSPVLHGVREGSVVLIEAAGEASVYPQLLPDPYQRSLLPADC